MFWLGWLILIIPGEGLWWVKAGILMWLVNFWIWCCWWAALWIRWWDSFWRDGRKYHLFDLRLIFLVIFSPLWRASRPKCPQRSDGCSGTYHWNHCFSASCLPCRATLSIIRHCSQPIYWLMIWNPIFLGFECIRWWVFPSVDYQRTKNWRRFAVVRHEAVH